MAFGKQKKKKEETAEELKAKLKELESEPEELDVPPEPPKVKKEGEFSLSSDEMALAVNALAASEEFKLYQQMVIGQQISEIIAAYNKAVGGKSGISSEDTEEELPAPE